MMKVQIALFLGVLVLAGLVVTSQHKARELFIALQEEQEKAKKMDIEWGQLQLEQSTWALHARIEQIARERLSMQVPDPKQTGLVSTQLPGTHTQ